MNITARCNVSVFGRDESCLKQLRTFSRSQDLSIGLICLCLLFPGFAGSQPLQSGSEFQFVDDAVESILSSDVHPYHDRKSSPILRQAASELYFLSPEELLWLNRENSKKLVDDALLMLSSAEDNGLQPADYDVRILKAKWLTLLNKVDATKYDLALFDTALSLSSLHYLGDLRNGRVNPEQVNFSFPPKKNLDETVRLLLAAIERDEIFQLTAWSEPDLVFYRKLKHALGFYRKLEREYLFPTFLVDESIHPGDSDPQIKILMRRLIASGDLKADDGVVTETSDLVYQGKTVQAVKHFQRRHGLRDDGIIGKKTVEALNIPFSERVRQIALSMERLRWLPKLNRDKPIIMVNIPAFKLWALESGDLETADTLNMKVVVGIAKEKKTPVFIANLDYLEFRPYWNVPKKITIEEILPKIQDNADYLKRHNMELVSVFNQYAKPVALSTESLELLQKGVVKVRQRPGSRNSLGLVKFIFPNKYAVYLHDTPAQSLFRSERRDFSHGCVRVEQPEALAEFILRSENWQPGQIRKAMLRGRSRRVRVDEKIAVLIFYSTVQVIDDQVYFFDDIYGYDTVLSQLLFKQEQAYARKLTQLSSSYP